jgi:hypothetical protein
MDKMTDDIDLRIAAILQKFPYLSYGKLIDTPYLGIIQNIDNQLISMYVLDLIPDEEDRTMLLAFGDAWWWGSNRQIPINVFTKDPRFRQFRTCLRMFSAKDFTLVAGPSVSIADMMSRRVRKRQVTLIRRPTE